MLTINVQPFHINKYIHRYGKEIKYFLRSRHAFIHFIFPLIAYDYFYAVGVNWWGRRKKYGLPVMRDGAYHQWRIQGRGWGACRPMSPFLEPKWHTIRILQRIWAPCVLLVFIQNVDPKEWKMIGMNEEKKRKTKLCCLSELYKLCPLGEKKTWIRPCIRQW